MTTSLRTEPYDTLHSPMEGLLRSLGTLAAMPFDLARLQYAQAVQAGLLPRSQLASARVEKHLDLLERLTLGPLARAI